MKALITGVSGQDGSYLSEYLISLGYEVYGITSRRVGTSHNLDSIHNHNKFHLIRGDLTDPASLNKLLKEVKPQEVYHLGAQSFVKDSWQIANYTLNVNVLGTQNILEATYEHSPDCRFYFAGSSEQFGLVQEVPQKETTPFYPRSPYGVSKVAGFWLCKNYRESYNKFICCGLLFNHTSPRRGPEFVERKISLGIKAIKNGTLDKLYLGNLDARRDIGHARDYVRAMHLMLQQNKPDDYVVAMNETHSIQNILDFCAQYGKISVQDKVAVDISLLRPAEVDLLIGDSTKIRSIGWLPEYTFEKILKELMEN